MGFRSTMITCDGIPELPKEFVEKYKDYFNFLEHKNDGKFFSPISTKCEMKTYLFDIPLLIKDLSEIIKNYGQREYSLVFLHECGGITKVDITKNGRIFWGEPTGWKITSIDDVYGVSHDYCYGCSDLEKIAIKK